MNRRYNACWMSPVSLKTKLLSLFVLAFICLNASGAVCLVYCQQNAAMAASSEHCPLPMDMPDCPHAKRHAPLSDHQTAATGNTVSCSMLAVNVLAAPLERKQVVEQAAQLVTPIKVLPTLRLSGFSSKSFVSDRFEPSRIDRRSDRLKNCIFRI
jgi:hypothetical protein